MTNPATVGRRSQGEQRSFWSSKRRVYVTKMVLVYLLLIIGGIAISIPFIWMVSTSLKQLGQVFLFPPVWIPQPIMWHNYIEAMTAVPFGTYFKNTVIISTISVVGLMLASSLAAYAFARLHWKGRDVMFVLVLSTMMLPSQVTLIPQFIVFRYLKWIDTFYPLTVPVFFGGGAFNIFLLRQFFRTIPEDLADAARIDGCSEYGIYGRIMMPLAKPALTTVAIFTFIGTWNDFMGPLLYLNSPDKFTVSRGLAMFRSVLYTRWDLLMAASTAMTLPIILVFFAAQRYFVQGVVLTGLKG